MKKKFLSKLTILAVTGTVCTSVLAPSVTTFASERNPISITQNLNTSTSDKSLNEILEYIEANNAQLDRDFYSSNSKQEKSGISITVKVAKKLIIKYKSKIISLLKKLPYGSKIAGYFTKYFDKLCNFLDTVSGGAKQAIYKFFRSVGFSHFWADLIADGIMTVLSWVI